LRILFVAMPNSIHAARWIKQLAGRGWDVHLFPVYDAEPHEALVETTFHTFSNVRTPEMHPTLRLAGLYPLHRGVWHAKLWANMFFPARMANPVRLASVIRRIKPDIVHSLEMQHAAYLTLEAKEVLEGKLPPWLVSSWGIDVSLFGRLKEHQPKVRAVLSQCDYFTADCERDLHLSRCYGFEGETFPPLPGAGGFDIELAKSLRPRGATSARKVVTLKGYQSIAGRALTGLRAIELCADALKDYRITVYFASAEVAIAAELLAQKTGLLIDLPPRRSYEDSLRMHGEARVSIAVSISDGLPLSVMEAALMGSFPVQTNTGCVGETTLLVPPDDPYVIAEAIRRAVTDDDLVDRAAELNFRYIAENLSLEMVKEKVIGMYEKIRDENPPPSQ
jgi:glycosyltransferase involved in cell wall biosynthesis